MTPAERQACLAALEAAEGAAKAAEDAAKALRAVLAAEAEPEAPKPLTGLAPLSEACQAWNVTKDAARKRAARGVGRRVHGRWYVPRSALTSPDA